MKLFQCQHCSQVLYFENVRCEKCAHSLGYLPAANLLTALEPQDSTWRALTVPSGSYRFCANAEYAACNWLVADELLETLCAACRHNRTIPDLTRRANLAPWRKLELAKHRLFYTLLKLRLPLLTRTDDPEHGLVFDFLADQPNRPGAKVLTGHDNGIITIALAEADDAEREKRRQAMQESYRTLLGHFRHEVGHHFWDLLVRDGGKIDECREIFGDERRDYDEALKAHYAEGAQTDWREHFVSAYATSHPWEDFAETWAHYLHIVDTLEMAGSFGLRVRPHVSHGEDLSSRIDFDLYRDVGIGKLVDAWLPITFAINSLNRCMGLPDLYPFILGPEVIRKLGFIHDLVHAGRSEEAQDKLTGPGSKHEENCPAVA